MAVVTQPDPMLVTVVTQPDPRLVTVVTQPDPKRVAVVTQPATGSAKLMVLPEGDRDWSTSMTGCAMDFGACVFSWCCLPCLLCKVAGRLGDCCLMPCCACGALTAMRTKVRTMGAIKGSICKDCMVVACCGPCAICQMSRELDNMGIPK